MGREALVALLNDALLLEELDASIRIAGAIELVERSRIDEGARREMLERLRTLLRETHGHSRKLALAMRREVGA